MIDIKKLTEKDIGKWVIYTGYLYGEREKGRIKSWNDKFIFVVYKCANEWDKFKGYTGLATSPEYLKFINGGEVRNFKIGGTDPN